jgi:signal transduction histidine kinase
MNKYKYVILAFLAILILIFIGVGLSYLASTIIGVLCVYTLFIMLHNNRLKIEKLESELIKLNAIDKIQNEKNQIQSELERTTSYNHHLSGIIAGLNHELSPWISGIYISISRMLEDEKDEKHVDILRKVEMATIQTSELLNNLSKNINKIKNFSVFKSNVKDTVSSWIQIVLLERNIKDKISSENIEVDLESLNFIAEHSPMYLSQVILNLAKNSIDHNSHMLESLKIRIYGDAESKYLIYEDNGKGIPSDIVSKIFKNFGVTTKKNSTDSGEIHGFGLYSCLNYCISMKAIIVAQSIPNSCTRFVIKFERINDNNEIDVSTSGLYSTRKE